MNLPQPTVPPTDESFDGDDERDSSVFQVPHSDVALSLCDPELRGTLPALLQDAGYRTTEGIGPARVVLFEPQPGLDLLLATASVRADAQAGAAILLIVDASTPAVDHAEHGLFACIRKPVAPDELLAITASALNAQSVRLQVADLSRRLDLQSHLASIGRIAAGVTHELANPLSAAMTCFEFLEERVLSLRVKDLKERQGLVEALSDAKEALERMRTVLRTMQEVARTPSCSLGPVRLSEVAQELRRWAALQPLFAGTTVEVVVDEDVVALAERARLIQILVNLLTNGAHAAKELPSPRVRLHVYGATSSAIVSVRDNGPGIPREVQEKIFEPFYTTRRSNGGTGLGLSLCREYALQMNAALSLWSARGRGSCFRLRLRRAR